MAAQEADLDVRDAEGRVAGRTVALGRYDALRDARPEMFAEAGPVVIVDPASSPHAGVVYADPWIMLIVDAVRLPDGRPGSYTRLQYATGTGEGVAILPVTETGVVLLEHWRHATQRWHLEIPRGYGEPDVASADQAAAELLEETGLLADIEPLGILHPDSGTLSFEVTLHLARVRPGQTPVADEGLASIVEMTFAEFETAIASGRISDSFTIAAWTRYALTRR
jgi:ADP-ribose pyrophosphatase